MKFQRVWLLILAEMGLAVLLSIFAGASLLNTLAVLLFLSATASALRIPVVPSLSSPERAVLYLAAAFAIVGTLAL